VDHEQFKLQFNGTYVIKTYYLLTKPGIIFGNLITTAGAFVLASKGLGAFNYPLFLATAVGLFFVIASACVFNNYIDREADGKMARTKNRSLATGAISTRNALFFAVSLGIVGLLVFALFTNLLAVCVASVGFFVYVAMYSFWKYRTSYATLVGSVSGAIPPVIGYCAASNRFDVGAVLLFMILVFWQMPHFFSIAVYRSHEYAAASIPVLPVAKGLFRTKIEMVLYIAAFLMTAALLTAMGYTGSVYLGITMVLGGIWMALCLRGFKVQNNPLWARQMFRFSLVVVMAVSLLFALDAKSSKSFKSPDAISTHPICNSR